jgi:hypothetical protein|tara:strand:+ start:957 stop:1235 length:279 start_codon:yes stop_codon:yes gene_type:complete
MRYHTTAEGNVPFTAAEETGRDAEEQAYIAGADDREAEAARAERDAKLTESDWTQVADATVDQATWATYRQSLRDVPEQAGFPSTIAWPTSP